MKRTPLATLNASTLGKRKRQSVSGPAVGQENVPASKLDVSSCDLNGGDESADVATIEEDERNLADLGAGDPMNSKVVPADLRDQIIASLSSADRVKLQAFMARIHSADTVPRKSGVVKDEAWTKSGVHRQENVVKIFDRFVDEETSLSDLPKEHLVRPSGPLSAPLGAKLHYPTFAGSDLESGEVANRTFSCIRVLMSKGLDDQICFWYECFFRREEPPKQKPGSGKVSPPTDHYSSELRSCHLSFSAWCDEQGPPIVLLFGEAVQKMTVKSSAGWRRVNVLDPPVGLLLLERASKIVKIGVIVPHPQYYLIALSGRAIDGLTVAKTMDRSINAAVALSVTQPDASKVDATYFERLLMAKRPSDSFNVNPRVAMVEGLQVQATSGAVVPYEKMHTSILDWLAKERPGQDVKAVVTAEAKSSGVSVLQVVQRWMTRKGNDQRNANLHEKRGRSDVEFERTVEQRDKPLATKCLVCGKVDMDKTPLFGTTDPILGTYIARTTKACSNGCCKFKMDGKTLGKTPRPIDLVSVDPSVPFITQLAFRKLVKAAK